MSRIPGKSIWSKINNKRKIIKNIGISSRKARVTGMERSWSAWCRKRRKGAAAQPMLQESEAALISLPIVLKRAKPPSPTPVAI